MIVEGLSLTVMGMLIVFGFLLILVAAMFGLNAVLRKFFPKTFIQQSDSKVSATSKVTENATTSSEVVAVAVASIKAHIAVGRG